MVILLTVGCLKSFSSSPGKSTIIFRSWTSWLGVNIGKEYGVLSYEKKNKKRKMRKSIKFLFICHFVTVKPTYVAQWVHFDDLNRNSHTCQRSTIEIDEREKISRFHHCHVIFLYPEIFRRTKTNFLKICNEKIWNPFHSKVTRNILHNFLVLSSWHSGYFYTCCNAKSPKTFYFQLCNLIWHVWRGGV